MADIVNLRRARKAKVRAAAGQAAAEARALHGRSKAEKVRVAAEIRSLHRTIDNACREDVQPD